MHSVLQFVPSERTGPLHGNRLLHRPQQRDDDQPDLLTDGVLRCMADPLSLGRSCLRRPASLYHSPTVQCSSHCRMDFSAVASTDDPWFLPTCHRCTLMQFVPSVRTGPLQVPRPSPPIQCSRPCRTNFSASCPYWGPQSCCCCIDVLHYNVVEFLRSPCQQFVPSVRIGPLQDWSYASRALIRTL